MQGKFYIPLVFILLSKKLLLLVEAAFFKHKITNFWELLLYYRKKFKQLHNIIDRLTNRQIDKSISIVAKTPQLSRIATPVFIYFYKEL